MSEIVTNERDLASLLEREGGKPRLTIVVDSGLITTCIPVIKKYNYALIDAEDLPNGFFKLTLELRNGH
ncbi:hypothetical protein MsedC_0555 [Metallosphaera sedula]|uniref:Uncharacterized protein n=3 Tax=Metallosphaera TaxID=41980 RepID=A4YE68_METS5|nr:MULTISPECIES: hypothetical protein [Metallosphaera]ABP94720.1 hypothetical protein Msed_0545 [Metallosphaera sedula DSM 5348]AKV78159.1 hypothetical protein MsedC_0555 [Metallosphaera sedula]AKV80404.1 hypothetical protein MsedD_0556 [Metallosphaera sedula]AKV84224.1 hypothetical protein MsedE_0556 [Metallosphaera sedula]MCY0861001.1 hypothetical protein [Metallosphaera prunae]